MDVTRENLQHHFKLLNDHELRAEYRAGELTDLAKEVVAAELKRRNIPLPKLAAAAADGATAPPPLESKSSPRRDTAPNDQDLVQAARYFTAAEAYLLKSRLEFEGIPAIVTDDQIVQTLWPSIAGGARVLVPERYFQQACSIAKAVDRGEYALDSNVRADARTNPGGKGGNSQSAP
jgi:hypothetical protein